MRGAFRLSVAAAAILVGGCGQSEEQVLAELRHQMMSRCGSDMAQAAARYPGLDVTTFCGCLTDKAFAGKRAAEVQELFGDPSRRAEQARKAAIECRPSDMPDLPPPALDDPPPPAAENKQKAPERPRRTENMGRPKARPVSPPSDGPIATPRPMPVPPAGPPAPPAVPPGFSPPPPGGNGQAPR